MSQELIRPVAQPGRRVGNTTRLVDYYIQELFTNWKAVVEDHYEDKLAHIHVMNRIVQRLQSEHRMNNKDFAIQGNVIIIRDPSKLYR